MRERYFRFKQFGISHQVSAMKVGVDAVLLGAWANISGAHRILDVGCGCGVISLMLAQRSVKSYIKGIDIDSPSVEEAKRNVHDSPWRDRVEISKADFLQHHEIYDLIVSNPPFLKMGYALQMTLVCKHVML